jgi:hypothetical protein
MQSCIIADGRPKAKPFLASGAGGPHMGCALAWGRRFPYRENRSGGPRRDARIADEELSHADDNLPAD